MLKLNHKKLDVWKVSVELVKEIYLMTDNFPIQEKFGLVSQLRRAAVSIPSNISEGSSRKTRPDRTRFFEIARSSLVEIDTQIELSHQLGYINENDITTLEELANRTFAMLSNLIKS
jgi:four helix bundle protein